LKKLKNEGASVAAIAAGGRSNSVAAPNILSNIVSLNG